MPGEGGAHSAPICENVARCAAKRQGREQKWKVLRQAIHDRKNIELLPPTKFELVINLKTAKALSLTIPPLLLQQADQIID